MDSLKIATIVIITWLFLKKKKKKKTFESPSLLVQSMQTILVVRANSPLFVLASLLVWPCRLGKDLSVMLSGYWIMYFIVSNLPGVTMFSFLHRSNPRDL